MRLEIQPRAEADLESIADYIAEDNPSRAVTFVQDLREQCQKIAKSPQIYRARPELGAAIRSCSFGNYLIIFDVHPTALEIKIWSIL